ncbi:unnamed protein product [Sphagnum compactum]
MPMVSRQNMPSAGEFQLFPHSGSMTAFPQDNSTVNEIDNETSVSPFQDMVFSSAGLGKMSKLIDVCQSVFFTPFAPCCAAPLESLQDISFSITGFQSDERDVLLSMFSSGPYSLNIHTHFTKSMDILLCSNGQTSFKTSVDPSQLSRIPTPELAESTKFKASTKWGVVAVDFRFLLYFLACGPVRVDDFVLNNLSFKRLDHIHKSTPAPTSGTNVLCEQLPSPISVLKQDAFSSSLFSGTPKTPQGIQSPKTQEDVVAVDTPLEVSLRNNLQYAFHRLSKNCADKYDDNDFSLSKSRVDPDMEKKDSPFIDLIDNMLSTTNRQKPSEPNVSVDDGQDILKRFYSNNRSNQPKPDCEKENQDAVTFDALDNGLLGRDKTLRAILNKNHYIS